MTFKVLLDEEAYKNLKKLDHSVNLYIRSWLRKNLEGCEDPRIHGKELKRGFGTLRNLLFSA